MVLYEYECPTHGRFTDERRAGYVLCLKPLAHDVDADGWDVAIKCFKRAKRKWGFQMPRVMQEHWNPTTNSYISSNRQFDDELKRASEAATVRSYESGVEFKRAAEEQGIDIGDFEPRATEHNFVRTEDKEQIGVSDEVKDMAKRRAMDEGIITRKTFS